LNDAPQPKSFFSELERVTFCIEFLIMRLFRTSRSNLPPRVISSAPTIPTYHLRLILFESFLSIPSWALIGFCPRDPFAFLKFFPQTQSVNAPLFQCRSKTQSCNCLLQARKSTYRGAAF
jgi:hypothetical protein